MKRGVMSVLAASAVVLGALDVSAQTSAARPERPYRGVYGSGTDQAQQVLSIDGSFGSGYDTSVLTGSSEAGLGPVLNPQQADASMYNQFGGGLSYTSSFDRWQLNASLSSLARQYPQMDIPITTSHGASVGGGMTLGRSKRTAIIGSAGMTYQSLGAFQPFPELGDPVLGQIVAPAQDFGGARAKYFVYTSNVGFTQQLSARTALTASYNRQRSNFTNSVQNLNQQGATFRLTRGLSKYLSLRVGYGFNDIHYDYVLNGGDYRQHNIDSGVDYSRSLSISRRTRLSFSTGATATSQDDRTQFGVIGSATLNREIGRTWNAVATYQRTTGFEETVRQPLFYDTVSGSFSGLISREWSFHSAASGSRGSVGMPAAEVKRNGFDAWNASAGLNRALNRNLSVGINYTYYRYNFEQAAALVTGLLPKVNRHSVNVTLSAWAPIVQRGRKPNATR